MTNEVIKAILDRRSIRSYTDQPVETEKLEAIIQAAINSPSARNLQPWKFTVIRNQALIAELQQYICDHYYNCTTQILLGLGQMYAAPGEMNENIDRAGGEGTGSFACRAIEIFCK
jgi:nitroreductase